MRESGPQASSRNPIRYCFKLVFPDGRWSVDEKQLPIGAPRGRRHRLPGLRRLAHRGLAAGRREAGRQAAARVLRLRSCRVTFRSVVRLNDMFLFSKPSTMVTADEALPGRTETMPVPAAHDVLGTPIAPPFPDGLEQAIRRAGLLLGRGAHLLAGPRRLHDGGRLRRRLHAEPDLRGGLLRPDRPHRGRSRRLRPAADELRRDPAPVLGGPRPDPGHAPGQRPGHPVPVRDLHLRRGAARRRRGLTRAASSRSSRRPATGRSRPRSPRPGRSTTPSRTTSSTSRRTRTATAGSAAPVSRAPSGSRPPSGTHRRGPGPVTAVCGLRHFSLRAIAGRRGRRVTKSCDSGDRAWPLRSLPHEPEAQPARSAS